MTLDLLFPHFDELMRTPEDVQRLNEAILQLAVQGKLVAQDPNDEPASELLKRIEVETIQKATGGQIPKLRSLAPIHDKDRPSEVPDGWQLVRLGQIVTLWNGRAYGRQELLDAGTPIIRIQNLNGSNDWYYSDLDLPPEKYCDQGDLLYAWSGTFGPYIWHGVRSIYHYHIWRIDLHSGIDKQFLYYLLKSITMTIQGGAHGIMLLHMTKSGMEDFVVPLPPIAEQHRIVAKVDELFAQTRALEASLRQAQADIVTANRAALHRLHTAQDDDQFQAAWRTLREHFDLLYDDPRNVAELRQAILDLAVRGMLVAQDPEDEPAVELLNRIEVEREQLVKKRLISAEDASTMQIDLALRVPIAILGEVRSGIQKSNIRDPRDNPRRYITVAHVQRNRVDLGDPRYFEVSNEELEKWRLVSGDVLVIEGNGSAEHIGRAALFLGEIEDCVHQNHVIRVRPNRDFILPEYLNLFLNSPSGREKILERSRTTSGLYNLSVGRIRTIEVPLPALSRQQRIVAKVDQLMRLCDALEAGLLHAQASRQRLVEAVLHGVTAG